ncbi:MAG: hypothetical protein HKO59_13435 [Phycisphaerales bacterium]|nr:hypothetical protein [Phycisphaerales bacterium]NNM26965.1 hypothetical protein [Phycisphaerales bacterium]
MTLMESLTKLYGIDRQVRGLRARLDAAERYHNAQQHQLAAVTQQHDELQTRKRQVQARIGNLETEGAGLDEQLEKYRNDLNSAATNKQYTAVLTELNTVKDQRSKLDDSMLEMMSEVERLDEEITAIEAQQAERAKIVDHAAAQLAERRGEVGTRLAELEAERDDAADDVPGPELAVFEEMANAHDGEAMAQVEEIDRRHREYACSECNMHMPFETVAALMSPGCGMVRCTACGRILFMQEEVRGALAPK